MKPLTHLFNRRARKRTEAAPQLTIWQRQAARWPGATFGQLPYTTYDEMAKDSMVQTVLTVKKLAVLASGWTIAPADSSAPAMRNVRFVEDALARMEGSPSDILSGAMDAFAKGWSVQESIWESEAGRIWLRAVRPKDPSLFGLDLDRFGNVDRLTLRLPGEAEQILDRDRFVLYFHRRTYAQARGQSDLDAAYPHWKSKIALLNAWRVHLERFAMPTVMGRYERGLPVEEQEAMLRALEDLQNNAAVVYPREVEVNLLGGSPAPSSGFQEAIDHHNREIARAVVGQTLTTDEGRRVGSLALGKVHLQVFLLQVNALRREIAETVMTEQVIRPLIEANFGPGLVPKFELKPVQLDVFAAGLSDVLPA